MRTIGLMSGTSLDGVDGVLVDFPEGGGLRVLAFASCDMPDALRTELLALNSPGNNELHRAALAANALVDVYGNVVQQLLSSSGVAPGSIAAIGAHGQTVRHRPAEFDGVGYTLQLNNPALLAERSGITVVADFRSRDVAAGGQGAPLVPAFHSLFLNRQQRDLAVLNIGGISNITLLNPTGEKPVQGFDCGPGNALLDYWCHKHTGATFDRGGAWGRSGQVHPDLLAHMLSERFFHLTPPKSTGRDLFNPAWLHGQLAHFPEVTAVDVQATLTALTAQACADSVQNHSAAACRHLLVCGGGAYNTFLMELLSERVAGCRVESTEVVDLAPLQVEACAFAWLAAQALEAKPGNLPAVTGAKGPRVLGAIYPA